MTSENSPVPFEIGDVVKWVLVRFFFLKIHYFSSSLLVDVSASFGNAFFLRIFIEHSGLHTFFY